MLVVAALAATVTLTGRDRIALASPLVRVSDVVDGRSRVGGMVIARLSSGYRALTVSRLALVGLIRRAVPGILVVDRNGAGAITFALPTARGPGRSCAVALIPIAAGEAITAQKVVRQRCVGPAAHGTIVYNPQIGEATARHTIAAGENLGPLRPSHPPAVRAGEALTLVSRAGAVTIERAVNALQPGQRGRRVFVRDHAGHVSSIELIAGARP